MSTCSVKGCISGVYSAGMCSRHYNRLRTTGTTDDGPRAKKSFEERFWSKVKRGKPSECWPWIGKSQTSGYGYITIGRRCDGNMLSNRAAWLLTHKELPDDLFVRHLCNNRICCNPAHLALGRAADNVEDMWRNKNGPRGNARLTEQQIADIRKDKRSSRKLAPIYGVSDAHIRSIRQGRAWKTLS